MMTLQIIKDVTKIIDFVYNMSIDDSMASYPRLLNYQSVKRELSRRIIEENSEVIAIYQDTLLIGVFAYYWIDEDNYMQTTIFVFNTNKTEAIMLSINHMKERRLTYRLLIGIPFKNEYIKNSLEKRGVLIESSLNFLCKDQSELITKNDSIYLIDQNNFQLFSEFYEPFAVESNMYWTSERIIKKINDFSLFCYIEDTVTLGCLLLKKGDKNQEIFALLIEGEDEEISKSLLNRAVAEVSKDSKRVNITYFIDIDDDNELINAKQVGFKVIDNYICYEL